MVMGLIELFKGFHSQAVEQEFPVSARVLYYTLLGEFNAAYWKDELAFTERDLSGLTGLPKTTIHEAKEFLASRHLIKTWKRKNATTVYRLLGDQVPTGERPAGDQEATSRYLLTRAKKDVKDQEDTENTKTKTSSTRAREDIVSDDLKKAWTFNNDGTPPSETETFYLADDVKLYGEEKVRQAIIRAGQKKRGSLSVYFYKMQLSDIIRREEGTGNGRRTANSGVNRQIISQYGGFGADAAPEG